MGVKWFVTTLLDPSTVLVALDIPSMVIKEHVEVNLDHAIVIN